MSSYNCEPERGSEFETGWQLMQKMARDSTSLTVVTRPGKNTLARLRSLGIQNTSFVFYDLPPWFEKWKRTAIGMQVVPYFWELAVFFFLLKRFSRHQFERAHRGTLGTYRYPSLLWYFAPIFTWGPIASGETVPFRFLPILSWKGRALEVARMILQRASFMDPLILLSLYKAKELRVVTNATKNMLPAFATKKAFVDLDFFKIDQDDFVLHPPDQRPDDPKLKLLYVGKLVEWKGLMFVLKALRKLHGQMDYEFNLVGEGPDRLYFQSYARKHGLNVYFRGRMARKALSPYYYSHDLFVSPDIHGRGSNTIVEAKMHGLPVLMLDRTDPDFLTGKDLNVVINTQGKSCGQIVAVFSQTLLNYTTNKSKVRIPAQPPFID